MDGFMRWLGLDGRAFVLQVMGFGCNVLSFLGTRVIRDRGTRLLAMLCIPFTLCRYASACISSWLPCSSPGRGGPLGWCY